MSVTFSLGEIAAYLDAEVRGDSELRITGLSTLQDAGDGQLTFLANPKYTKQLATTKASAVILAPDHAEEIGRASCRERV